MGAVSGIFPLIVARRMMCNRRCRGATGQDRNAIRTTPTNVLRAVSEQVSAAWIASFRNVNISSLFAFQDLLYAGCSIPVGADMKLSALEILCVILASVVAVVGFAGAVNALVSAI